MVPSAFTRCALQNHLHVRLPVCQPHTSITHRDYITCDSATRFTAIHFKGGRIWPVSCYTLLRRCRLPWPRSGCLDPPTPFRYWAGNSAPLSPRSVEPVLPALLTNADPLYFATYSSGHWNFTNWVAHSDALQLRKWTHTHMKHNTTIIPIHADLQFENTCRQINRPRAHNLCLTRRN